MNGAHFPNYRPERWWRINLVIWRTRFGLWLPRSSRRGRQRFLAKLARWVEQSA